MGFRLHTSGCTPPLRSTCRTLPLLILLFLLQACKESTTGVIDTWNAAPKLLSFSASPARIDLDSLALLQGGTRDTFSTSVLIQASALTAGTGDVLQVDLVTGDQTSTIAGISMTPSSNANGTESFSGTLSFSLARSAIGSFFVRGTVVSALGIPSSTELRSISVVRTDRPPVLSDLQVAPDTLVTAPPVPGVYALLQLTVRASDPDGQQDIARVIFYTTKPDGTLSNNGQPFMMYDDGGASGSSIGDTDAVAGDGTYTLAVKLPYGTAPGRYKFEFQAFDRIGAGSNKLTQFITVQ